MSGKNNADGPQDSQIVIPGEYLGLSEEFEAGHGVIIRNDNLMATKNGIIKINGKIISIEPLHSQYVPRPSDLVIGFVEGCTNNIWFIDIGAPFNAILPMSLGPSKASFGSTRQVLDIGEAILCRVQEVEETHSSVVTMKGMGLRKIKSGSIDDIDPHLIVELSRDGNNSLRNMKETNDCRIITADNGRIWIDGEIDGIISVRNDLNEISINSRLLKQGGVA
ncbi:MAG: exosome complex component RRP4 [Candidatus Thalassarchaeaceae archaeon]|jgi:exosome complex component RRP4